jgi:hypothetical protein
MPALHRCHTTRALVLSAVLLRCLLNVPALEAQHQSTASTDAIEQVLLPRVTPPFQSSVLVLGTPHLAGERSRLTPAHLASLHARLAEFAPTRIAIEALSGDEIALLAEREAHDSGAAHVLETFARSTLVAGRAMQQALGVTRVQAEREALARVTVLTADASATARVEVAALLLAAYDFNSAALQWSYLPAEVRARDTTLPADVRSLLDRRLGSANEIVTVAMPLARRVGLQVFDAIDSQYDGIRTLALPSEVLTGIFGDPARGALYDSAWVARAADIREAAFAAGDLLPMYRFTNSDASQAGDQSQWHWLFEPHQAGTGGRFRYAMWELRNLRQATRILEVAASRADTSERVLVLVGSSHKTPVERALRVHLTVRVVNTEAVLAGRH